MAYSLLYYLITYGRGSIKVYSVNKSRNACPSLRREEMEYIKFYSAIQMKILNITSLFLIYILIPCFFEYVTTNCPRVEAKSSSSQV